MLSRLRRHMSANALSYRGLLFATLDKVLTEHSFFSRASAIAFSAMMAFVPFLMLSMSIAVRLLPDMTVTASGGGLISAEQLADTMNQFFPHDMAGLILEQIGRLQEMPSLGVLSFSILLSTWTASSLFVEIFDALNRIYGVRESRPWWRLRLMAIGLVVCQCVLIFGSLLTIVFWPQIIAWMGLAEGETTAISAVKWLAMFCLMMLSFGLTYQFGPAVKQNKKWVSPGAVLGTVFFLAASYGFRVYVQHFANYSNAYGPLGGVMMLLLWLYISSLVLLMGAEMNKLAQIANHKED